MVRARFDQEGQLRTGPGSAVPYSLRLTTDVRLVPQAKIVTAEPIVLGIPFWVTWNGLTASAGGWVSLPGIILWDYTTADVWEIPSGSGIRYRVILTQLIVPDDGTPYNRALVQPE